MISISNNFIFIHISKCAGTSVCDMLAPYSSTIKDLASIHHPIYSDYESVFGESIKDFLIFTIVRNPYDRLLSLYTYWKEQKAIYKNKNINDIDVAQSAWKLKGFNEWVEFIGLEYHEKHLDNQMAWILNNKNEIENDICICRFETLEEDIKKILYKLNIDTKIPHLNKSKHDSYKKEYSQNSIDIATIRFKKDLEYFGYSF